MEPAPSTAQSGPSQSGTSGVLQDGVSSSGSYNALALIDFLAPSRVFGSIGNMEHLSTMGTATASTNGAVQLWNQYFPV